MFVKPGVRPEWPLLSPVKSIPLSETEMAMILKAHNTSSIKAAGESGGTGRSDPIHLLCGYTANPTHSLHWLVHSVD